MHYGVIALVILLLLIEAILGQWQEPIPEFSLQAENPAVIQNVFPRSAAEAAGVKAGDVIQQINGVDFDWTHFASFADTYRVGENIHLVLKRGNQSFQTDVPLIPAAQPVLPRIILFSVILFIYWASSTILLWRFFQKLELRILYLFSLTAIVSILLPAIHFTSWNPLPTWQVTLSGLAACLSAALCFHFSMTFPGKLSPTQQRKVALVGFYAISLIAAALWTAAWNEPGFLFGAFLTIILVTATFLAAFVSLIYYYNRHASPFQRRQLRLIFSGMLIAILPPFYLYSFPKILWDHPLLPGWIASISLVFGLAVCVYVSLRQNLMRADQFLNRMIVYFVLFAVVLVLFIAPLIYLDLVLPRDWVLHACVMAGLTLFVAFSFNQLQGWVQKRVDGLFYGGWYDYPKVIGLVSGALSSSLAWEQLQDILVRQVPEYMQLSGAKLELVGKSDPPGEDLWQPQIQIPLEFEGEPYAIWTIGPRNDGDDFSSTDRHIFSTLAPQVDVALSNILLVEKLHQQLGEIQGSREALTKMGHQLIRSREEEKARLSRELHDGPLQELVGMNLQLGILLSKIEPGRAGSPLEDSLVSLRSEVRSLMTDLRQICTELRPPMLDTLGLSSALHALADEWSEHEGIPIKAEFPPDSTLRFVPSEVSMNVYRVVQEALSNIAHHAEAHQVILSLIGNLPEEAFSLTVQDDGKGFELGDLTQRTDQDHFGLVGMQERVGLIRGRWEIQSAPARGTTIQVSWNRRDWLTSIEPDATDPLAVPWKSGD